MKKGVYTICICSLILLFAQCAKDRVAIQQNVKEEVHIDTIRLNPAELNIVPYVLNDSVIFKDSLGHSKIFRVVNRSSDFPRLYTGEASHYYDIEQLSIELKDTNGYFINILLEALLPPYFSTEIANKNHLYINLRGFSDSLEYASPFISIIDSANFYYTLQSSSIYLAIPYHPAFTILNKTYNSVYELINMETFPVYYISKVFYNKTRGIVGFQMNNETKWYLDN